MKPLLTVLSIFLFCACAQQNQQTASPPAQKADSSATASSSPTSEKTKPKSTDPFELQQDSLRNEILKRKDNTLLKNSFLQEMYLRDVVQVANDSLHFNIPFNLHALDCGAPDCYSNDFSFSFRLGDALIFPKNLPFREHEHGCTDKETHRSGTFSLIEQTDKHIIYHSSEHKITLVLLSPDENRYTNAFYFNGVEQQEINGTSLYKITDMQDKNFDEYKYPNRSWVLSTNDYEHFLK